MNNYKYVMQDNNYDCGIASLMTCFLNMGKSVNKQDILDNISYTNSGINAYDLISASNRLGVKAHGVKCKIDILNNEDLPCIAHTIKDNSYYHYLVILKITNSSLIIFDPAFGISNYLKSDFSKITTGVFILFNKLNIIKCKDVRFKTFIYQLVITNPNTIGRVVITSLLLAIFTIVSNYYLKTLMEAITKNDIVYLIFLFAVFLNIYIIKNVMNYIKNRFVLFLNNKIDKIVNKKIIVHLFLLPYKFFAKRSAGELSTIVNDIDSFKDVINKIFVLFTVDLLITLIIGIYIAVFNIYFFIVSFAILILLLLISYRYQNLLDDCFIKVKKLKIRFASLFISSLNAYDSIKNLGLEQVIINKNNKECKNFIKSNSEYSKNIDKFGFTISILNDIYYISILFFSIILCFYKKINLSDVILFSGLFSMIIGYFFNLCDTVALFKMYKSSVSRVLDIMDVAETTLKQSKFKKINNIKLENVSFKYADLSIISDLSIEIKAGKNLFIDGPSGVGKSTIIKLLLKYYDDWEGQILIDNINLKFLSNNFMRSNIMYVSQNEILFNDTLYNNMKIVCDSKYKIDTALKTCLVDRIFSNKAIDYNFLLDDNGKNLSSGQRKKIIIARALLKAKNFLVLDESFNEIGVDEEKLILNNIFNNYKDLTIILISHRKTNKKMFDDVLTIKEKR